MILVVAVAVAIGIRDARERIIPNGLVALLATLGLGFQALRLADLPRALPWTGGVAQVVPSPVACVACAVAILVVGTLLELAHRSRSGAQGVGLGDVKCLAAWAVLEGHLAVMAFGVACLAGAIWAVSRGQRDFALGPWMCAACVAVLAMCPVLG